MSSSLGEKARTMIGKDNRSLTDVERECVAMLYDDGWTVGELEMTFMAGENTVRDAIREYGGGR